MTQAAITSGCAVLSVSTSAIDEPIVIATLGDGGAKHVLLDVEFFPEDEFVAFNVTGDATLWLSGTVAQYSVLEVRQQRGWEACVRGQQHACFAESPVQLRPPLSLP